MSPVAAEEARMKTIDGRSKTVRELLSGVKYTIDFYQREYKWGERQIVELLEDLLGKFMDDYDDSHEPGEVENYGHYFLGSVVISRKNNQNYIIDGQQRLTSLTLLLIYLHNLQIEQERADTVQVQDLIFSERLRRRSFNLDVEERTTCMEALFNRQTYDADGKPESVGNILARYQTIEEYFPEELKGPALPFFIDWLLENVHLVEIVATSDEDAYTIFETMNDRGLSLSLPDMLKGYLLSGIGDEDSKRAANQLWQGRMLELLSLSKEDEVDFFKAWLRAKYAETIRERKKNAKALDFDRIGTEFHRWVREHRDAIGLTRSSEFSGFIERDFSFFSKHYVRLRHAALTMTPGLESVYYVAHHNFTLQYPLLLAPLTVADPPAVIEAKIRMVAAFLDIFIARRIWNFHTISYSTMQYAMFLLMRDIRNTDLGELAEVLTDRLAAMGEDFATNDRLRLHQQNRPQIHHVLARITHHIESQSGMPSRFEDYVARNVRKPFEIEHIWADKPGRHRDEFPHAADFGEYRNRIGGLILLQRGTNQSFNDATYEEKLRHYEQQNLLARSLGPTCYEKNPNFLNYLRRSGLPFQPHEVFSRADLDTRQALYQRICEEIWNPARILAERESAIAV
jgi:hypothetical protein